MQQLKASTTRSVLTLYYLLRTRLQRRQKPSGSLPAGADPFVLHQPDGTYLYILSHNLKSLKGKEEIQLSVLKSLDQLGSAPMKTILSAAQLPNRAAHQIWAPEIHLLNGYYYIYFAASDGRNKNHHMHVAKSRTNDPFGPYEYVGKIATADDHWAIDGTVLVHNKKRYFIWSGWEGSANVQQNLYIAEMSNPTRLTGSRVCISTPSHAWEKRVFAVNEGPAVLQRGGRTFVSFSASASWTDFYCIGLLELRGSDPLDPTSWHKYEEPLLKRATDFTAPGHNSFTKDQQRNDVIVYHTSAYPSSGWNRVVRYSPITWKNGRPTINLQ